MFETDEDGMIQETCPYCYEFGYMMQFVDDTITCTSCGSFPTAQEIRDYSDEEGEED